MTKTGVELTEAAQDVLRLERENEELRDKLNEVYGVVRNTIRGGSSAEDRLLSLWDYLDRVRPEIRTLTWK